MEWRTNVLCFPGKNLLFIRILAVFQHISHQSNNDEEATAKFTISAPGMREMVDIAALNSRVKFDKIDVPFDQRVILGDATETGLTRFAGRSLNTDYDSHQKTHPKVFEVPFNSTNKWALVIVSDRSLR